MTPFDLILHFFSLELTAVRLPAKLEVSSFNGSRDIRGSKNSKSLSNDPHMTLLSKLGIFSSELTAVRLCVKFEISSFKSSRYIMGSQNSKNGSRDPQITPLT